MCTFKKCFKQNKHLIKKIILGIMCIILPQTTKNLLLAQDLG
jgi:hypothetical protein